MNGYERVRAVLEGGKTDRPATMLHSFMPAVRQSGYTMKEYREDADKMAKSHMRFVERYGLDGILLDMDTCLEAYAVGVPVDFPQDEPARTKGALSQDFDVLLRKIQPACLEQDARVESMLEATRLLRQELGGQVFLRINCDQGPFSLAALCYGMTDFMMDLLDEELEEGILALIERCGEVHWRLHELAYQAGADCTSFGDSTAGPDLMSAACYRKFALPFHKKLQKALEAKGQKTICHICGNLDIILEDVASVGFAGVEADYKTDIIKAHRALQGKSVLFGYLDPTGLFTFGSAHEVKTQVREILNLFEGKNIVLGSGCALPPMVPTENIEAYVEAMEGWRMPVVAE